MIGVRPSITNDGHDLIDRRRARLPHGHPELVEDQLDHLVDALLAERAKAPHVGTADPHRVGAERQGLEDVGAAADAAVDEHRNASPYAGDDLGQRLDRRAEAVLGAAAVVGHEDAVHAVFNRQLRLLARDDALEEQLHARWRP